MNARILRNAGFNTLGVAATSLIALLLTPYLYGRLGSDRFGVWALCGVALTFGQMLDLGVARALVRLVAQKHTARAWVEITTAFNSAFWPLVGLAATLAAVAWLLSEPAARQLGAPLTFVAETALVLRLLALAFPLMVASLLFAALLDGAQHMHVTSSALLVNRLLFAGGVLLALRAGGGVGGVAWAQVGGVMGQTLVLALAAFRLIPGLRLSLSYCQRAALADHLQFGSGILVTSLAALGFTATNKVALAYWAGLTGVAHFELAALIASQLFVIASAIAYAVYPPMAVISQSHAVQQVWLLYVRGLHLIALSIAPLAALAAALASPFVALWLGQPGPETARALPWLAAAWLAASMATIASIGMLAAGQSGRAARFSVYNTVINLILAAILAPRWGFWGIVAGNTLAVTSSALLTLWSFGRHLAASPWQWFGSLQPRILAWVGLCASGLGWAVVQTPATGWTQLLGWSLLYFCLVGAGMIGLRLAPRPELARMQTAARNWLHTRGGIR